MHLRLTVMLAILAGTRATVLANVSLPRLEAGELIDLFVPMVGMQGDRRQGAGPSALGTRFGATGIVRCGGAIGTAQLVMRSDS
jgi:hypothetical protein